MLEVPRGRVRGPPDLPRLLGPPDQVYPYIGNETAPDLETANE